MSRFVWRWNEILWFSLVWFCGRWVSDSVRSSHRRSGSNSAENVRLWLNVCPISPFFLTTFQLCFNLIYWNSIPSSFISTDFVEIGLDYSAEISVFGGNSDIFPWFTFKIWINFLKFVNGLIHFHRKIRRLFGGKFPRFHSFRWWNQS